MKKLVIGLFLLLAGLSYAQNSTIWSQDYYGSGLTSFSNNLTIAVGDSASGVYYIPNTLNIVKVDSNWTASKLGFLIENPIESSWYPLADSSGTILKIAVSVGKPAKVYDALYGVKKVKFIKLNDSDEDVDQATNPTYLSIESVGY